jgi:hypothetical protein
VNTKSSTIIGSAPEPFASTKLYGPYCSRIWRSCTEARRKYLSTRQLHRSCNEVAPPPGLSSLRRIQRQGPEAPLVWALLSRLISDWVKYGCRSAIPRSRDRRLGKLYLPRGIWLKSNSTFKLSSAITQGGFFWVQNAIFQLARKRW